MADDFDKHSIGLDSPAWNHFAITPDDGADITTIPRCLWVGGGNIAVRDQNGVDVTYEDILGFLPIRALRVLSTGTTATNIIGMY